LKASTRNSCVAFAQKGLRIDALVTDVQLSGYISGLNVAETLRSLDLTPLSFVLPATRWFPVVSSSPIHTKQQNHWNRARAFVNSWIDSMLGLVGEWCY